MKKEFSTLSNSQTDYHFKLYFQKVILESYCDFYTHEQWAGINHIQVLGAYVGAQNISQF